MKTQTLLLTGLLSFLALLPINLSHADDVYTFVVKKQEEKQKSRWSISEWIETRDRMRLMDLWLALHSPSQYEFFLTSDYEFNQRQSTTYNTWRFDGAAYASLFGLEFQKEFNPNRYTGLFDFRFFGYNNQNTNMTFQVGISSRSEDVTFRNPVMGGALTIYIMRMFGLDGFFRHSFASIGSPGGATVTGTRYEGGAFLDFKFLRVFGTYFSEPESRQDNTTSVATSTTSSGVTLGTRLYF